MDNEPPGEYGDYGLKLPPSNPTQQPLYREPSASPPRKKNYWGPLGFIGLLLAKFGSMLKFAAPFAKTGLSMLLSSWVYSQIYGWSYGVGFVLLIFVHELGHVVAAKWSGIEISAPLFIPFVGAQILLRQQLPDAWVEAKIGVAGPIAGSLAAAGCHVAFLATGMPLLAALAHTGYFLNFFNMIPIVPLDGGRIMAAISPWAWLVGYSIMAAWLGLEIYGALQNDGPPLGAGSFILLMVLVVSLPRVLRLFRGTTIEDQRYYAVSTLRRWSMAGVYFGLVAFLWLGMLMIGRSSNSF